MKQYTVHDILRCVFAKYICKDAIAVNFLDVSAFSRFVVDEAEHNELYTIDLYDIENFLRIYKQYKKRESIIYNLILDSLFIS